MNQYIPLLIISPMLFKIVFTDINQRRIPNKLILLSFVILFPTLYLFSRALNDPAALSRSITGGFCTFLFFYSLHAIYPSGLGLGDVKLSSLLGAALTWDSFNALFYGVAIMFVASTGFSLLLLLRSRNNIKASFPFAPFMLVGTVLGVLSF